jgi:NhaP-type Na+/H+ or K+/H+ antiporter
MQDVAPIIAVVGAMVFLAHFFTGVFSRTRVPDVLFLIVIGICLGPLLGLVSPAQFGQVGPVFATITLIIILFECGTTLRLSALRSALGGAIELSLLTFLITTSVVAGLTFWLTDLELVPAFIFGAIVGSTSEAIVIPLAKQLGIRDESHTILSLESSLTAVLSIVVTIALIEAYVAGQFEVIPVTGSLLASFLVAIVLGITGGCAWAIVLHRIRAVKNTMFTTPAFVFVVFGVVEILGFNGAIAALAFGITMGNIEPIHSALTANNGSSKYIGFTEMERVFFSEAAFLLKTFFFVYLGICLELLSARLMLIAVMLVVVASILRVLTVKASIGKSIPVKDASIMAVMIPRGLTAVVLASIPLHQGIPGGELIRNLTCGVVLVSILATSILLLLLDKTRLARYYGSALANRGPTEVTQSVLRSCRHWRSVRAKGQCKAAKSASDLRA